MPETRAVLLALREALIAAEDAECHIDNCDECAAIFADYVCPKGEAMQDLAVSLRSAALREADVWLTIEQAATGARR